MLLGRDTCLVWALTGKRLWRSASEDAVFGTHCYSAVTWAKEHGLKLHPTWCFERGWFLLNPANVACSEFKGILDLLHPLPSPTSRPSDFR